MKYKFTVKQQYAQTQTIVGRSYSLWRLANISIARILANPHHRSRKQLADHLNKIAGPRKRNEPVSMINFRVAARIVRDGSKMILV